MLYFACSTEYFPLTLALSLKGREQQASDWCLANACWALTLAQVCVSGTGVWQTPSRVWGKDGCLNSE